MKIFIQLLPRTGETFYGMKILRTNDNTSVLMNVL